MKPLRLIWVLLLVFVCGVVVASGAQAEEAPFFSINGTRLAAGKTHNVATHAIKPNEIITAANATNITCTKLTAEKEVLLGSEAGTEGHGVGVAKFEGCELKAGNGFPNCHLAETEGGVGTSTTITTNLLHGELVENVEGGKAGKILLELITPASGSQFVKINFGGTECKVKGTIVTGSTAAEVVKDTTGEERIELPGPTPEESSFIGRFPATAVTEVWLVSGGTGKIVKVGEEAFTNPSKQLGTGLVLLANAKFEPERTAKWSPLP